MSTANIIDNMFDNIIEDIKTIKRTTYFNVK